MEITETSSIWFIATAVLGIILIAVVTLMTNRYFKKQDDRETKADARDEKQNAINQKLTVLLAEMGVRVDNIEDDVADLMGRPRVKYKRVKSDNNE